MLRRSIQALQQTAQRISVVATNRDRVSPSRRFFSNLSQNKNTVAKTIATNHSKNNNSRDRKNYKPYIAAAALSIGAAAVIFF